MTSGEWLTRITAALAFVAWFAALSLKPRPGAQVSDRGVARIWLAGSLIMLAHTALAFHFYHGWSHAAAVVDTARQTRELTGLNWGGGVWLNYLFAMIWLGDAGWRIAGAESHARRPRWLAIATHAFLAFIWFNATVVFGSWPMRAAGAFAFIWLATTLRWPATARKQR